MSFLYTRGMFVRRVNNQRSQAAGWDDLRAHNTALLLRAVWAEEGQSRADLARSTGLSRATVSDIVSGFIEIGVVTEAEVAPSSGGRPPIRLEFQDNWRHLIGLELGAAHVAGVRTDLRGRVIGRFSVERDVSGDVIGTLATLDCGIRTLLALDIETRVIGLGLGVPCPLRSADDARLDVRLFPRWTGVNLRAHLQKAFGLPVRIDNDANLGALAEHWWGAGQDVEDLAYIKLATGVGAGILIGGEIHRGATGIAGEIGHTTIDPNGPACRCGLNGCLEAMVGAASLVTRAKKTALEGPSTWATPTVTVRALIAAAGAGDPLARSLVTSAGASLGIAIANLLNLVNPGRVILGGRLTEAGPLLVEPLLAALEQRALWTSVAGSSVVLSTLGDDAVPLGAATLVLQFALSHPEGSLWPIPASVSSFPSSDLVRHLL